ncbi:NAD(P)/FAD-dependent oxidoreductase [Shinella sp. CPCC 101442]|uniref:NAD(P)/FAD-dependent oxidoreductase n=1 Tax=Shinella sp. CPCC 101442 TaxID=2932265 RepID=UPI002152AB40|nr:NAD(P)/FAD-dependent oxidoreductase [Shinella sp. CPCC 101442]MCR6502860.1 NAD(P)/FAD-dependent oxidoreductase [Shinella sp. CPCC 101442]
MNSPGVAKVDCIVVGGGPAGLTAAIYLARYHLSVVVFDDESSRAATIPISHNHAGFPDGVSGVDLLMRMRSQAENYGAKIERKKVTGLRICDGVFNVVFNSGSLRARSVLLATGVANHRPAMPDASHDEAVAHGLLRYCPVCDGFEITDKRVGVIGAGTNAFREAVFLRSYTSDLTLVSVAGKHGLSDEEAARLNEHGIAVEPGPITSIEVGAEQITITTPLRSLHFSAVYPALGSDVRSGLVSAIGAALTPEGCVVVDTHQRTTIPGLYAAGDVVIGLDQISHAMGQAGVAATTIRNDLCEITTLVRP